MDLSQLPDITSLLVRPDNPPRDDLEGMDYARCAALHNYLIQYAWLAEGRPLATLNANSNFFTAFGDEAEAEACRPRLDPGRPLATLNANSNFFTAFGDARKAERLRKKSVAQLTKSGLPIPPELEDPITDPEADSGSEYESGSEGGSERGSGRGREFRRFGFLSSFTYKLLWLGTYGRNLKVRTCFHLHGIHGNSAPLPPPATVDPYVASFKKITILKFPVMLREARTEYPAEVRGYFGAVLLGSGIEDARRLMTIRDDDMITKGTGANVVHSPGCLAGTAGEDPASTAIMSMPIGPAIKIPDFENDGGLKYSLPQCAKNNQRHCSQSAQKGRAKLIIGPSVRSLSYSSDAQYLLTTENVYYTARLWNLQSVPFTEAWSEDDVQHAKFGASNSFITLNLDHKTINMFLVAKGPKVTKTCTLRLETRVVNLFLSPSSMLTVSENGDFEFRDLPTLNTLGNKQPFGYTATLSLNEQYIVISRSRRVEIGNARDEVITPIDMGRVGMQPIFQVIISPNSTMVASVSKSSIEVWNLPQHNSTPIQQIHQESEAEITHACFSPNDRYLLIGYYSGEFELVDSRHGRIEGVGSQRLTYSPISDIGWSPCGRFAAFVSLDGCEIIEIGLEHRPPDVVIAFCRGIYIQSGRDRWFLEHFQRTFHTEEEYMTWLQGKASLQGIECIRANCVAALAFN
ncbi:hypothetical protein V496_02456 [Pseudogymnoascus sp. VKM F-4515 (FW-2607)]|nr:hypothetical protein V496_02456 [Pseudogymnoascus sp. VKM F-4515 (FW-2607)]